MWLGSLSKSVVKADWLWLCIISSGVCIMCGVQRNMPKCTLAPERWAFSTFQEETIDTEVIKHPSWQEAYLVQHRRAWMSLLIPWSVWYILTLFLGCFLVVGTPIVSPWDTGEWTDRITSGVDVNFPLFPDGSNQLFTAPGDCLLPQPLDSPSILLQTLALMAICLSQPNSEATLRWC